MNKIKKIALMLAAFTFASLLMTLAAAAPTTGTANSVSNVDLTNASNVSFTTSVPVGQTVYIHWTQAPSTSTVYINVTFNDLNGNLIPADTITLGLHVQSDSGSVSFVVPSNLAYGDEIYVNFYGQNYVSYRAMYVGGATIFVLPESAIGALAALGAGFAAFGVIKLKRKIY